MDVDTQHVISPSDELISYFPLQAEEFAWGGDVCDRIRARRASMSGVLFFDILLQLGGILDPSSLYPPQDLHALRILLDAIKNASYDEMKRNCLMYYLLRQCSDGREVGYVSEKVISPHLVALADAYWLLDMGLNLDNALSKLSDARIVKEYPSKIIETLSLDAKSGSLIRKYVRTSKPALREPRALERYIIALAEHSIVDAWKYQRNFPDTYAPRKPLIHALLLWTLSPKPKPQPLTQLLALPFTKYEEIIVQEFAKHPPEELPITSVSVVRDMVCVRLIQNCKYVQAVKFDRQYPSSGGSPRGTWGAERERIVKEILSIMPAAERRLLETELEALGEDARVRTSSSARMNGSWTNASANGSADLSASWEEIGKRASKPRKSLIISSRPLPPRTPRASLSNGYSANAPLFSANASPSISTANQTNSSTSLFSSRSEKPSGTPARPLSSVFNHVPHQVETPQRPLGSSNSISGVNGVNGSAQKTNGFMIRNAFFRPPGEPSVKQAESSTLVNRTSPKRTQVQQEARLPTPPQEEPVPEKQQENDHTESEESGSRSGMGSGDSNANSDKEEEGSNTVDEEQRETQPTPTSTSDREDLNFSIFDGFSRPTRISPLSGNVSPSSKRKSPIPEPTTVPEFLEVQRKRPRVSVPGAFIIEEEAEHDLPSPHSASIEPELLSTAKRHNASTSAPSTSATRRSSRKRAASPEDDGFDTHHLSIPGTLIEDEEVRSNNNSASGRTNGTQRTSTRSRRSGYTNTDDEDAADEVGPLPRTRSSRRRAALSALSTGSSNGDAGAAVPASPAVPKTPRRGRSARAGSVGVNDEDVFGSGRPVRRSSRLSSPHADHRLPERVMMDSGNLRSPRKNTRPRKSTRTAGAGATATGRGATKRR